MRVKSCLTVGLAELNHKVKLCVDLLQRSTTKPKMHCVSGKGELVWFWFRSATLYGALRLRAQLKQLNHRTQFLYHYTLCVRDKEAKRKT